MCGIFGVLNCGPIDHQLFRKSLELLNHRGPDSTKLSFWDEVGFGFTRLRIQDLTEAGDQPMSHHSRRLHIIFNGEIYNFKILREELKKKGIEFFSQTDTEVILCAYAYWGWQELLKRLEGMFAFALFDEEKARVYLARDRFGQKPFFTLTIKGD